MERTLLLPLLLQQRSQPALLLLQQHVLPLLLPLLWLHQNLLSQLLPLLLLQQQRLPQLPPGPWLQRCVLLGPPLQAVQQQHPLPLLFPLLSRNLLPLPRPHPALLHVLLLKLQQHWQMLHLRCPACPTQVSAPAVATQVCLLGCQTSCLKLHVALQVAWGAGRRGCCALGRLLCQRHELSHPCFSRAAQRKLA